MNNEPVAWTTDKLDTNEWEEGDYQITVTKEKWSKKQIPLYTHPMRELTDEVLVAHVPLMAWEVFSSSLFILENNEITNDEFIKRCYEVVKARCNHPQPDYTQFNTQVHPFKTLTDEEIESAWFKVFKPESGIGKNITNGVYEFARLIRESE